jgi:hypothetical protein
VMTLADGGWLIFSQTLPPVRKQDLKTHPWKLPPVLLDPVQSGMAELTLAYLLLDHLILAPLRVTHLQPRLTADSTSNSDSLRRRGMGPYMERIVAAAATA